MSVTEAARILGVGRPALSNLLNGKATLSADMAARLEEAFKYPRTHLLEMQARYNAALAQLKKAPPGTRAYVPPFLSITANDIVGWVEQSIAARSRLPVFLRTLVHSAGGELVKVDFPGNDDAERPGWDGIVEAIQATPWVPVGRSGWEFGTSKNPKAKAESDFKKRVKALDEKERVETTFVFVTPRRWSGKEAWLAAKQAEGLWKDVVAYDASNLEQWLEQSLPAQAWFANETDIPAKHVRSLDRCWRDWAEVSTPPLTDELFDSAIEATRRTMLSRLSNPSAGPILIAADSTDEALAFLAQILGERGGEKLASYRDRVLVFDKPGALRDLAAGAQTFIPVVTTREVERELAPYANSMHCIVIYPRNAVRAAPDIVLEPANFETFDNALKRMGKRRDEISRLAHASGRSLTVLRRQLATVQAVQTPQWAADHPTAASLVPFLLVGAWDSQNEADRAGISLLAGDRPYEELEKECQHLAQLDDAPMWSVGNYRGVISKKDLLYAIAGAVTADDLERYFLMAGMVLGEDDPALDLAKEERWAASIHGKTREFSAEFREGISETLVLLAVDGGALFKGRLGVDTAVEAVQVVRELLPSPLTTRVLEANDRDLPTYAEAAPDEFLSILERDLNSEDPSVLGLLRPADPGVFGSSPRRTGLMWALEGLSWSPETVLRAASILACLAKVEINDNWVNKPAHSLESIFRAWMPQTAASHEQRVAMIQKLAKKYPDVAWQVCVAQFDTYSNVGHYSHKPRWRPDGYGFGEPFSTWEPINAFRREMVEMALTWNDHTLDMLCDLVERLPGLTDTYQSRVWALIKTWAQTRALDAEKATMREKIRLSTLSRRAALRARKRGTGAGLTIAGKAAYDAVQPSDVLNKHAWLFRDVWVEESADEIADLDNLDDRKREERISNLRAQALGEILSQNGLVGIIEISERGNASWAVGMLVASKLLSEDKLRELIRLALAPILAGKESAHSQKNLIAGVLHAVADDAKREAVFRNVAASLPEEDSVLLLTLAPYGKATWKIVDTLGKIAQAKYWREVVPKWIHASDEENSQSVQRLLKAGRPRAAFSCVRYEPAKLDARLLFRLLSEMPQGGFEKPNQYLPEQYDIERAIMYLGRSPALTLNEKVSLEYAYIEALAPPWDRRETESIPNLERYVEEYPEMFVQAIVWTYKRDDGVSDPPEFQVPSEKVETMAKKGFNLLKAIKRIPGHNDIEELEEARLSKWITAVRESCAELSRAAVADRCIGELLSCAPVGKDGVWPCVPVREVLEEIQSEPMMQGAHTGVYNSRGVHERGEGGDQERELAEKYRKWGVALRVSHPFVAAQLLQALAATYEHDAQREDTNAGIRRRLH